MNKNPYTVSEFRDVFLKIGRHLDKSNSTQYLTSQSQCIILLEHPVELMYKYNVSAGEIKSRWFTRIMKEI